MPITTSFEDRLVHLRFAGKYTFEESLRAIENAVKAPQFHKDDNLLLDISGSEETRTSYEMEELAARIGAMRLTIGRRVALCVKQAHHYGLARMHSIFGERYGMTYAVFVKLDEAKRWLRADE